MLKTKIEFEVKKDERIYSFYCDPSAPLGEIFDVLCMIQSDISKRISEASKKQEQPKEGENGQS
jgi:hypothetical protein